MKKVIEDLASKNGLTTGYSGALRIMYIKGEKNHEFIQHIKKLYPNLVFQLKAAIDPPKTENEKLAKEEFVTNSIPDFVDDGPAIIEPVQESSVEVSLKPKPTFQEVDLYLLANPIDRKAKGPYNAAAEHFGVKPDYIRKRWLSLRERKLVEQDQDNVNA